MVFISDWNNVYLKLKCLSQITAIIFLTGQTDKYTAESAAALLAWALEDAPMDLKKRSRLPAVAESAAAMWAWALEDTPMDLKKRRRPPAVAKKAAAMRAWAYEDAPIDLYIKINYDNE